MRSSSHLLKCIVESLLKFDLTNYPLGIYDGKLGAVLFLSQYQHYVSKEPEVEKKIELLLREVVEDVESFNSVSLAGLGGFGWLIQRLKRIDKLPTAFQSVSDEIDLIIRDAIDNDVHDSRWWDSPDLLYGATGAGIYFLERSRDSVLANELLDRTVCHLIDLSETQGEYCTWFWGIPPKKPSHRRYSLGLAHGVPSIILFLIKAEQKRAKPDEHVSKIIRKACYWLLQFERSEDNLFSYPDFTDRSEPSRLAWCNGDLGVSLCLFRASRYLQDSILYDAALRIALKTCKRDLLNAQIYSDGDFVDTGFCHGVAGISHMYLRLFQETNDFRLKERHSVWTKEILKQSKWDDAMAGFISRAFVQVDGKTNFSEHEWTKCPNILEGVSGVGLSLLTSIRPEVKWDTIFLTD